MRSKKVIVRLASGSDDPRSTNETFDDSFSSKGVRFNLAYAEYTPVPIACATRAAAVSFPGNIVASSTAGCADGAWNTSAYNRCNSCRT